jgi:hypothetical protein
LRPRTCTDNCAARLPKSNNEANKFVDETVNRCWFIEARLLFSIRDVLGVVSRSMVWTIHEWIRFSPGLL